MSALATRDSNARPKFEQVANNKNEKDTMVTTAAGEENKRYGMGMHQQMMGQKNMGDSNNSNNGKGGGASYVSPSDAIQSPASKKLADFKQRQMYKTTARKPAARTLFARTASSCSSGLDDAETVDQK